MQGQEKVSLLQIYYLSSTNNGRVTFTIILWASDLQLHLPILCAIIKVCVLTHEGSHHQPAVNEWRLNNSGPKTLTLCIWFSLLATCLFLCIFLVTQN